MSEDKIPLPLVEALESVPVNPERSGHLNNQFAPEPTPPKDTPNLLHLIYWWLRKFILVLVFVLAPLVVFDFYYASYSLRTTAKDEFIEIPQGASLDTITNLLYDKGIIPRKFDFYWLARAYTYKKPLQKGFYSFVVNMTLSQLLDVLSNGRQAMITITIPEGVNARQIFTLFKQSRLKNEQNYDKYFTSTSLIARTPFLEAQNIEGFLFPDTYNFPVGFSEQDVLSACIANFLTKLPKDFADNAARLKITPYKLLILASIVEKESGLDTDRSLVASVFYNRLRLRMKLQTDPTVLYAKGDDSLVITKQDLKLQSPYNTYLVYGLPPSPISNPGLVSIEAVMHPKDTNYLYFVSKGGGQTFFSQSLGMHNKAVNKYQRTLRKKKTKSAIHF